MSTHKLSLAGRPEAFNIWAVPIPPAAKTTISALIVLDPTITPFTWPFSIITFSTGDDVYKIAPAPIASFKKLRESHRAPVVHPSSHNPHDTHLIESTALGVIFGSSPNFSAASNIR